MRQAAARQAPLFSVYPAYPEWGESVKRLGHQDGFWSRYQDLVLFVPPTLDKLHWRLMHDQTNWRIVSLHGSLDDVDNWLMEELL